MTKLLSVTDKVHKFVMKERKNIDGKIESADAVLRRLLHID